MVLLRLKGDLTAQTYQLITGSSPSQSKVPQAITCLFSFEAFIWDATWHSVMTSQASAGRGPQLVSPITTWISQDSIQNFYSRTRISEILNLNIPHLPKVDIPAIAPPLFRLRLTPATGVFDWFTIQKCSSPHKVFMPSKWWPWKEQGDKSNVVLQCLIIRMLIVVINSWILHRCFFCVYQHSLTDHTTTIYFCPKQIDVTVRLWSKGNVECGADTRVVKWYNYKWSNHQMQTSPVIDEFFSAELYSFPYRDEEWGL